MTKRKTSVIGFPRIGKKRELKFASESFFKGDITEGELRQVAADLRRYHATAIWDLVALRHISRPHTAIRGRKAT